MDRSPLGGLGRRLLLEACTEELRAAPPGRPTHFVAHGWPIGWQEMRVPWAQPHFGGRLALPRPFVGQPHGEAFGDLVTRPPYYTYQDPRWELYGLPTRTRGALYRAGFWTVSQLASATDQELLEVREFGRKGLAAVRALAPVARCPTCGQIWPGARDG